MWVCVCPYSVCLRLVYILVFYFLCYYTLFCLLLCFFFFFFQAEDGIRDHCVTGVQTCALPILHRRLQCGRQEFAAPTPPKPAPAFHSGRQSAEASRDAIFRGNQPDLMSPLL